VSGNTQPGEPKRKAASVDSAKGVGADDREGIGIDQYNGAITGDQASTLGVNCGMTTGRQAVITLDRAAFNQGKNAQFAFEISDSGIASPLVAKGPSAVCYGIGSYDSNAMKSDNPHSGIYVADTSRTLYLNCGNPACNQGGIAVVQPIGLDVYNQALTGDKAKTLHANEVFRIDDIVGAIQARDYKGGKLIATRYIVRRLTPLECERLQGFPDGWTDIGEWIDSNGKVRKTSDANRYKALGNSISLPNWKFVLKRLCACYERDATMASLFDGIGGFPYLWQQLNGKGSCMWASEIEEFPIAVTKKRFGE
jgi:DNA (cytosine-5)-methyltransferase 1